MYRFTFKSQYAENTLLFHRGVGLSADQGASAVDLMNSEFAAHGQEARNALQLKLLENREMNDAVSGLAFLRALPEVDARDVAVIGHSFGGSLTLLLAERAQSRFFHLAPNSDRHHTLR